MDDAIAPSKVGDDALRIINVDLFRIETIQFIRFLL